MLLSELFSEDFGSLPDDVEKHPAVWQEVSSPLPSPPPRPTPVSRLTCGDRDAPGGAHSDLIGAL